MTLNGWLHIGSCMYLALVVTLVLGVIENDNWGLVLKSTVRRWLKLIGALIAIGVVVQTCTFVAEKNRPETKKTLDDKGTSRLQDRTQRRPPMSS